MNRFVKYWRNQQNDPNLERGFSLVELIASLTLISVVLSVVYASITFGMNTFNKVRIENSLRDEGDIIMSSIITKLYQYGPDEIEQSYSDTLKQQVMLKLIVNGVTTDKEPIEIKTDANGKGLLYLDGDKLDLASTIVVADDGTNQAGHSGTTAPKSYIKLICRDNYAACSSGLIEIRLSLAQTYGGKTFDMDLVSRFGF